MQGKKKRTNKIIYYKIFYITYYKIKYVEVCRIKQKISTKEQENIQNGRTMKYILLFSLFFKLL